MSISPRDLGDQWQGLEPEQPPSSRAAFWVALLATLLLLVGALALAAFLLTQSDSATGPTLGGDDSGEGSVLDGGQDGTAATSTASDTATDPATALAPTVTLPGQLGSSSQAVAVRLPAPPTIDGNLAEWAGVPTTRSDTVVFAASTWDGTEDLEASWQLAWDEAYLYVAVTIADDIHAQNQTGNTLFRGDSLDLQFDTDRSGDFGPRLSPDDFQLTLSPGDFAGLPPAAFRFQGTADDSMLDAPGGHSVQVAAQPQPSGYTLEAAIPWRDLNLAPSPGMEIGLALNASDNDQPGVAAQELMKSNAPNRTFSDPTTWGTLLLQ